MCQGKNKNIIIITKCEIFLLLYISLMNSFFLISKELHIYYSSFILKNALQFSLKRLAELLKKLQTAAFVYL